MMIGVYKIIPVALPFILGALAAWNNWPGFALAGVVVGAARMIKRVDYQQEGQAPGNISRHHSYSHILADALLPFPRYLLHSKGRELVATGRKVIDATKGCLVLGTLGGVNAWAGYWYAQQTDESPKVQLISAAWSANIFYLLACATPALCQQGDHAFKNSLDFVMENFESFAGPLYLAFFGSYLQGDNEIGSAAAMWTLWSALLMTSLVGNSKKGKLPILAPAVIYYLWQVFTIFQFAQGKLIG